MRLLVDTRNGLAGDIMAAGLIGLGASPRSVTEAMELAGNKIGSTQVVHACEDDVHRMLVKFKAPGHLHAAEARKYLGQAMPESGIVSPWSEMGLKVLEAMIEAEGHVHSTHPVLKLHFHGSEPVLHEASDILIDIVGMAAGMMALDITELEYLDHVNVGGGTVEFSHGSLDVPTPATRHILDSHGIVWKNSDACLEMTTPTGASILAGCNASRTLAQPANYQKALAGGTRSLPPVRFMLI